MNNFESTSFILSYYTVSYYDYDSKCAFNFRYVCWTAYLLRYHGKTGHVEPVPLPGAPFSHYYATDATDEGIIMETDISVKEVRI